MEKTLFLRRQYLDHCTMGKIYYMGRQISYTVEKPWANNEKNISCIPPGTYKILPFNSEKHPDSYALENKNLGVTVLGPSQRTACLLHVANWPDQVEGCIGPGLRLMPLAEKWGVANSGAAMREIKQIVGGADGWELVIEI